MKESPRFKLFALLLAVIALVATLYAPTQTLKLEEMFFGGTASPHNTGYLGTSELESLLKGLDYDVVVAEDPQNFLASLQGGGLGVFIAPDKPIPPSLASELLPLFKEGEASFLVADENTTSNTLIEELTGALVVDGRAVFAPVGGGLKYTPFPEALMAVSENATLIQPGAGGKGVFKMRLNWASYIEPVHQSFPRWVKTHYVLGITSGIVDSNNNGRLDAEDLKYTSLTQVGSSRYVEVAAEVVSRSGGKVLIFSDSFPFTNQALTPNGSVYRAYVAELFRNLVRAKKVVICDFLYNTGFRTVGLPYHPALLLYFAASAFKLLDSLITSAITSNSFLALTASASTLLLLTYLIGKGLGFRNYRTLEPSTVEEVDIMAETEIKKAVLTGEAVKNPKEAVKGLWELLNYVLKRLYGFGVEEIISDEGLLKEFSKALNSDPREIKAELTWLIKLSRKASGKSHLPLILSWKRALRRYAELTEQVLEPLGYTLMRRGGLRSIESIIH